MQGLDWGRLSAELWMEGWAAGFMRPLDKRASRAAAPVTAWPKVREAAGHNLQNSLRHADAPRCRFLSCPAALMWLRQRRRQRTDGRQRSTVSTPKAVGCTYDWTPTVPQVSDGGGVVS